MIWLTADLNLFHKGIIERWGRPFKDLNEMHASIAEKWNSKVSKDDTVYVVGNVGFLNGSNTKEFATFIQSLNGLKNLAMGGTDSLTKTKYGESGFNKVEDIFVVEGVSCFSNPSKAVFYRCPNGLAACGGIYKKWKEKQFFNPAVKIFNVGVDENDFAPVSIEEILDK
jgi:calcineurin-like phosphoesterase family protein